MLISVVVVIDELLLLDVIVSVLVDPIVKEVVALMNCGRSILSNWKTPTYVPELSVASV